MTGRCRHAREQPKPAIHDIKLHERMCSHGANRIIIAGDPMGLDAASMPLPDCGDWWVPCWDEFKAVAKCALPPMTLQPGGPPVCIDGLRDFDDEQNDDPGLRRSAIVIGWAAKSPGTMVAAATSACPHSCVWVHTRHRR